MCVAFAFVINECSSEVFSYGLDLKSVPGIGTFAFESYYQTQALFANLEKFISELELSILSMEPILDYV